MSKWEKSAGLLFAAIAAGIAIWMIGNHFGLDKETWPGWVQAVGSIAAIYAAFEVGRRQADAARKEAIASHERLVKQRRDAIDAIVIHAQEQASALHKAITTMPLEPFRFAMGLTLFTVDEAARAIEAIPFHELGSAKAVTYLTSLLSNLKTASAGAKKFASVTGKASDVVEGLGHVTTACSMAEYHAVSFLRESKSLSKGSGHAASP